MDDEVVALTAIRTGGRPRQAWLGWVADTFRSAGTSRNGMRLSYLLVLLALVLAAIIAATVGAFFLRGPSMVPGHNGVIVYSIGPNGHQAVTSVAIDPDGQGLHQIEAGRCPAYSRDGKVLAWMSYEDAGAVLNVAGADGAAARRMLLVQSPQQSVPFELSPDGTRVAWIKPTFSDPPGSELWVAPIGGSPGSPVDLASSGPAQSLGSPTWSPDGRWIAFGTYARDVGSGDTRRTAIDVIAADGSEPRRLSERPGPTDVLVWSPDSQSLVYVGWPDEPADAGDIFVVGVDGTGDRNLTGSPAAEREPAWSPDSAFLAFRTSVAGETPRLATLEIAGATSSPPARGPEAEWFVWSPDGRELLWSEVLAVDAQTNRTTLYSIDRGFQEPPKALQVVDGLIVCTPSWQRLDG